MSEMYKRRYFIITDSILIDNLFKEYDALKDNAFNKLSELFPNLSIVGYTFITFGGKHELIHSLIVNELPTDNSYKSEPNEKGFSIKPNLRSKKGKEFKAKLEEFTRYWRDTPISCANFLEKKLNANHYIRFIDNGNKRIANPVIQTIKDKMLISIPTNEEDDNFPTLPSYVTEIKHSEYIAMTEE